MTIFSRRVRMVLFSPFWPFSMMVYHYLKQTKMCQVNIVVPTKLQGSIFRVKVFKKKVPKHRAYKFITFFKSQNKTTIMLVITIKKQDFYANNHIKKR